MQIRGIGTIGLLLVCSLARAETPPEPPRVSAPPVTIPVSTALTLDGVVNATYQRNPNLQVFRARLQEAAALRTQADSFFAADPALWVRHNTSQIGSQNGLREWEWGLVMPIWLPGQKAARLQVAQRDKQGVTASEKALRLSIAGTVRDALWQISLLRNQMTLALKEWQTAQELERDVAKRVKFGDLAKSDLILAQQETLTRQEAYMSAAASLQQTFSRYRTVTGLDSIPAVYKEKLTRQDTITDRHPALDESMAQVATAQARVDQSRRERRENPTLTLGTRHEQALRGEGYENTIGIIVNVPLGLESQAAPRIAAAQLALSEAMGRRDELKRQLTIQMQQAAETLQATRKALNLAQQQNRLSRENLVLARKSFALGESDLFTLLRVQRQAFNAEQTLRRRQIELQYDIANYNQALGVLP